MSKMTLTLGATLLGALLGFGLGRATGSSSPQGEAAAMDALPSGEAGAGVDPRLIRAMILPELRDAIHREVTAACSGVATTVGEAAPATTAPAAPAEPSPEAQRAFSDLSRVVSRAVASGSWTAQDRDQLRLSMSAMTLEQRNTILQQLVPAINDGRVKPDPAMGMPF